MTPVNHWEALEHEPDPSPETLALLELREQNQILAAAVERLQGGSQPAPETDGERLTFLTNWIVGYVGSALTRDHAESLARALLTRPETQRVLAPAPPPWPVLPDEPPSVDCSPCYREGRRSGWLAARVRLADMNPDPQWEGRNDG
jgi:hypothetical protein